MKKLIYSLLFFVLVFSLFGISASAQNVSESEEINVYFFWAEGCPHCEAEKAFLAELQQKYVNLDIHYLEVTKNRDNAALLAKVGKELDADVSGVPFTVVGEQHFTGWLNKETTGKAMEDAVQCAMKNHCADVVSGLVTPITQKEQPVSRKTIPEKLNLPVIGEVETKNISLPLLTVLIAGLDGFNPCAMWVLLFLISLLFGMKAKWKMWLFGLIFIGTSAVVYFLFMSAWLSLFMFLGFVFWVRLVIGAVALWAAYYNLKDFFANPEGGCKVTGEKKRQRVFDNLKKIIRERNLAIAILGLIALGFIVNLVELVCSLGLPAVYTQILALSNLPAWGYYLYLALYVFIYVLPLLIIFLIAMITLQLTGISTKYGRIFHLIGGIIMLVIGLLMIFNPGWLMLG